MFLGLPSSFFHKIQTSSIHEFIHKRICPGEQQPKKGPKSLEFTLNLEKPSVFMNFNKTLIRYSSPNYSTKSLATGFLFCSPSGTITGAVSAHHIFCLNTFLLKILWQPLTFFCHIMGEKSLVQTLTEHFYPYTTQAHFEKNWKLTG